MGLFDDMAHGRGGSALMNDAAESEATITLQLTLTDSEPTTVTGVVLNGRFGKKDCDTAMIPIISAENNKIAQHNAAIDARMKELRAEWENTRDWNDKVSVFDQQDINQYQPLLPTMTVTELPHRLEMGDGLEVRWDTAQCGEPIEADIHNDRGDVAYGFHDSK